MNEVEVSKKLAEYKREVAQIAGSDLLFNVVIKEVLSLPLQEQVPFMAKYVSAIREVVNSKNAV